MQKAYHENANTKKVCGLHKRIFFFSYNFTKVNAEEPVEWFCYHKPLFQIGFSRHHHFQAMAKEKKQCEMCTPSISNSRVRNGLITLTQISLATTKSHGHR